MIIDWKNTHVILMGASEYKDKNLPAIPNVRVNINSLRRVLKNPEIVGISNVTEAHNLTKRNTLKRLDVAIDNADRPERTLIVYYAGHGVIDNRQGFSVYLATKDIDEKHPDIDGIGVSELKNKINNCSAGRKIVILDACHSGQILKGGMTTAGSLWKAEIEQFAQAETNNDVEGLFILASAGEFETALYPEDKPNEPTFFSGKLIDILKNGLHTAGEYITLNDIYNELKYYSKKNGLPEPKGIGGLSLGEFKLAVNQQFSSEQREFEFLRKSRPSVQKLNEFSERVGSQELKLTVSKFILETKELNAWKRASKKNTKHAFEHFNKNYPQSRFRKESDSQLNNIEDKDYWYWIKKENSIVSFKEYINKYPRGIHAKTARKRIQYLKDEENWMHAFSLDTRRAYLDYLSNYPDGEHVKDAMRKVEQLKNKTKFLSRNKNKQLADSVDNYLYMAELAESKKQYKQAKDYYYKAITEVPANPYIKNKMVEMRGLIEAKNVKSTKESKFYFPKFAMVSFVVLIVSVIAIISSLDPLSSIANQTNTALLEARRFELEGNYQHAYLVVDKLFIINSSDSIATVRKNYKLKLDKHLAKQQNWLKQFRKSLLDANITKAQNYLDSLQNIRPKLDEIIGYENDLLQRKKLLVNQLIRKADALAQNEATYLNARELYQKVYSWDKSNRFVRTRIASVNTLIDTAFNQHLSLGKLYMKSRHGADDAEKEFVKAYELKPNSIELIMQFKRLESINSNY